jgi:iron(III) transport system substrate-binding protein
MRHSTAALVAGLALLAVAPLPLHAQQAVVNLYSARHCQTDEALYSDFTKATDIRINRIEAGDEQLVERLKSEGAASPADVLLIVDAARLWQTQQLGLFAPVKSSVLDERIPAKYRDPDGHWFGFSYRARVIVYNKTMAERADVATYEALADPKNKGKVCTRSGNHPYNLSLIGSMIAHRGMPKAEAWARGVVANFARAPKGGDTDQIKAVAAGECGVALSNSYYYARLMRSTTPADREVVARTALVFPDQNGVGTHVNVSGAGVMKNAPNRTNAIKFLEYLASNDAQRYFADGNNEWPVVPAVKVANPALEALGTFKIDPLPIATLGRNTVEAQKLADRVGWK